MMRPAQLLCYFIILFLLWNGVEAINGAEETVAKPGQMQDGMGLKSADDLLASWLRMFGALVTVLSIFFMGVFLFRKYGGALQNKASQGHLKVLEYRALNQKNSMYVLDYQGEKFLVATCQQGSPVLTPLKGEPSENENFKTGDGEQFKDEIRKAMNAPS